VLPITWAASKGHTAVVKALLDKGANPNGGGGTGEIVARSEIDLIPLHAAARSNRLDCLKLLLDRGANIEQKATYNKEERALHVAAMADAKACTLELLKRGADFGAIDTEFKTVIEKCSGAGAVATLELLVSWEQHGGEAPRKFVMFKTRDVLNN
jgi:ankyrin repeat protein